MLTRADPALDRPMILFQDVIEVLHRSMLAVLLQSRAWRTIAGYEAIHMIRKGQAYGSAAGQRSVYCTASLLICLELKPNSYDYRAQLPSIYSCNTTRGSRPAFFGHSFWLGESHRSAGHPSIRRGCRKMMVVTRTSLGHDRK